MRSNGRTEMLTGCALNKLSLRVKILAQIAATSATPPICAKNADPVMRFDHNLTFTSSNSSSDLRPSNGSVSPAPIAGCGDTAPDWVSGGGRGSVLGASDMVVSG